MNWRLPKAKFEANKGDNNRKALRDLVMQGKEPGVLAYHQEKPIGWCAVAPRSEFLRLENTRVLAPIDDEKVWSIVCVYVDKAFRGRGIQKLLLVAACRHAMHHDNLAIVEGYPVIPKNGKMPDAFAWTGIHSAFLAAGFRDCRRHSENRPIVRWWYEGEDHPVSSARRRELLGGGLEKARPARPAPGKAPARKAPPKRSRSSVVVRGPYGGTIH